MQRPDARVIAPPMTDVPSTRAGDLATQAQRLPMGAPLTLIGVAGAPEARRALLRRRNGRILTVQVGDRTPRGEVKAIGADEVILARAGRAIRLSMPD